MIKELTRRYKHHRWPLYFTPLEEFSNNSYTNCLLNYAKKESEENDNNIIKNGFIFPVRDYYNYQVLIRDQTSGKLFSFPSDYLNSVKDVNGDYVLGAQTKRFKYSSILMYAKNILDAKRAFRTILNVFVDFCKGHGNYDSNFPERINIYCYQMMDQCFPIYTVNKYMYDFFFGDLYDPKEDNMIYTNSVYEFTTFNIVFDRFIEALTNQTIYN